ncbi:hypothetical protein [Roseomonas sp. KE2513]|uniref:hypothetical protein n=1 Tax=Roseomonas sp. KE2513 TaxID=2479202 RepID=UPI0018DFF4E6|nr:hypothetical protein [Roseomonas sp. KE2513]
MALITGGADAAELAAAVGKAAEGSLQRAGDDGALRQGFWLLTQLPLAAREADFGEALLALGLDTTGQPSLIEIGAALMAAVDRGIACDPKATDFSEMAATAAVESLVSVAGRDAGGLFGTTYAADDARTALHDLAKPARFAVLARDFFARVTREYLAYYLSRVLPDHVGGAQRFPSLKDHHVFERALEIHCRETSEIVEENAASWFSKTNYEGGITPAKAGEFARRAFAKVRTELQARAEAAAHA